MEKYSRHIRILGHRVPLFCSFSSCQGVVYSVCSIVQGHSGASVVGCFRLAAGRKGCRLTAGGLPLIAGE